MSIVEQALKKLRGSTSTTASVRYEEVQALGALREPRDDSPPTAMEDLVEPVPRRRVYLDRNALLRAGFLPPESEERRIADQFRQIKRPLIAKAQGRHGGDMLRRRRIMIAGSMPGEGKTFTAVNLAFSMSMERDTSVLLVDADVAKPHISKMFGIADEPGLLDSLRDDNLDPETLILETDVPGLSVLPAGTEGHDATELLASERMRQVVERLGAAQRGHGRVMLFDSPPLLLTNESRVLAENMGQVVLVVKALETPQEAVMDALDLLGEDMPVGLILNQSEIPAGSGYYYRGGAYGTYGSYGERAGEGAA